MRILIADDSLLSRMMLKKVLSQVYPGCTIVEAASGTAAIEAVEADQGDAQFSLVLLDYMMPGLTGLEVLEHIRSQRPHLPVMIVTANIQDATYENAMRAGATGLVHKTLKPDDLQKALEGVNVG